MLPLPFLLKCFVCLLFPRLLLPQPLLPLLLGGLFAHYFQLLLFISLICPGYGNLFGLCLQSYLCLLIHLSQFLSLVLYFLGLFDNLSTNDRLLCNRGCWLSGYRYLLNWFSWHGYLWDLLLLRLHSNLGNLRYWHLIRNRSHLLIRYHCWWGQNLLLWWCHWLLNLHHRLRTRKRHDHCWSRSHHWLLWHLSLSRWGYKLVQLHWLCSLNSLKTLGLANHSLLHLLLPIILILILHRLHYLFFTGHGSLGLELLELLWRHLINNLLSLYLSLVLISRWLSLTLNLHAIHSSLSRSYSHLWHRLRQWLRWSHLLYTLIHRWIFCNLVFNGVDIIKCLRCRLITLLGCRVLLGRSYLILNLLLILIKFGLE